jgi:hypothetical protein
MKLMAASGSKRQQEVTNQKDRLTVLKSNTVGVI